MEKCDICGEKYKKKELTPYWNSNIEVGYDKVCLQCHNLYDDYCVVMTKKCPNL